MSELLQPTPMDSQDLLRIASVDDDPTEHVLMSMAMSQASYPSEVTYFNSGADLLEALAVEGDDARPDVILLDLLMPGMNGYDTLERLQTDPTVRDIPVVIFSSSDRSVEADLAHERGAALFQTKPQDLDSMQIMIGSLPLLVSLHQMANKSAS